MIKVILNNDEILTAAIAGLKRQVNAIARDGKGHNNQPWGALWQNHVEGALAECAVAKHQNKFWSIGDKADADLNKTWEVRTTSNPQGYLVLRKNDAGKEKKIFILVRGSYGEYEIVGWMRGEEAMQEKYWGNPTSNNRDKAWFVPGDDVHKLKSDEG